MKKLLVLAAIAVFSLTSVNAQEDNTVNKVINEVKGGGFYVGANIGFSILNSSRYNFISNDDVEDFGSINFGVDVAYLFEVMDNLEVGGLVGYTHYLASGQYFTGDFNDNGDKVFFNYKDAGFVPISSSVRYYFGDRKFFGGIDLGFAINVSGDDVDSGLYLRPKFGFNLGKVALIASYQRKSGGASYNDTNGNSLYNLSGFASFNVGAEFNIN
jgi:hypothetical protein